MIDSSTKQLKTSGVLKDLHPSLTIENLQGPFFRILDSQIR